MNRKFVITGLLAAGLVVSADSASAQRRQRTQPRFEPAPSLSISPYGGYMVFGSLADGPLNTKLSSASAPVFGAQVNLPLGNVVSIVGNVAYSEPDLRIGVPIVGGIDVGKSSVWLYDAGFQLSAPTGVGERSIVPFVQVGAGAMKYNVQVAGMNRDATNMSFNAGVGADVPLGRNLGLRLVAKDYLGKFDFDEATTIDYKAKTSHNVALSAGLKLAF
ncbi:MAG TPA: outer membrane beta-barrel protein [Gemmatimonadaceae bacterium]|nr:outer membrane beta-barrel protein [Gemmatimonadaceae bacterium]